MGNKAMGGDKRGDFLLNLGCLAYVLLFVWYIGLAPSIKLIGSSILLVAIGLVFLFVLFSALEKIVS